jgi:hypothetical protein
MKKEDLWNYIFQWGVLVAIIAVAWPDLSWAEDVGITGRGGSIGGSLNDFRVADVSTVPPLVNGIAYTAGAVLGISGALKLKAHAENPQSEKLAPGLGRLLAGGAVAALPTIIETAYQTLHMSGEVSYNIIDHVT